MIKHTGLPLYNNAVLTPRRKGEIAKGVKNPKRKSPLSTVFSERTGSRIDFPRSSK